MFVPTGVSDNVGVTGVRIHCRGPGIEGTTVTSIEEVQNYDAGMWGGGVGSSLQCGVGTAVCSLTTRVQSRQGTYNDDAALTDAKMKCCDY